ncbi:hypothetical protein Q9L58_010550 [Maublancomyces gigas]|uniref:Uncharacterized protein n=1 Tax=Discina gigas TaxID=1032678 RepID=A0ABR3G418_9PEZI
MPPGTEGGPRELKSQVEIDTADKDRLEAILAGKPATDPSYKAAYAYAVKSVMDQIECLIAEDETYLQLDLAFEFEMCGEKMMVALDYDNSGHDPEKRESALFGKDMEETPESKWNPRRIADVARLKQSYQDRWSTYPHFGWVLSYKQHQSTGHAYIKFGAMLMERAARPKVVNKNPAINESKFRVPAPEGINIYGVRYRWINYEGMRQDIATKVRVAEHLIAGLKEQE